MGLLLVAAGSWNGRGFYLFMPQNGYMCHNAPLWSFSSSSINLTSPSDRLKSPRPRLVTPTVRHNRPPSLYRSQPTRTTVSRKWVGTISQSSCTDFMQRRSRRNRKNRRVKEPETPELLGLKDSSTSESYTKQVRVYEAISTDLLWRSG